MADVARSRWGSVRTLPSGNYQARYQVDNSCLAATRTDLERGNWIDPNAGDIHASDGPLVAGWTDQRWAGRVLPRSPRPLDSSTPSALSACVDAANRRLLPRRRERPFAVQLAHGHG